MVDYISVKRISHFLSNFEAMKPIAVPLGQLAEVTKNCRNSLNIACVRVNDFIPSFAAGLKQV
jgi:hypothetical protein